MRVPLSDLTPDASYRREPLRDEAPAGHLPVTHSASLEAFEDSEALCAVTIELGGKVPA
jgi:hypothetical protein